MLQQGIALLGQIQLEQGRGQGSAQLQASPHIGCRSEGLVQSRNRLPELGAQTQLPAAQRDLPIDHAIQTQTQARRLHQGILNPDLTRIRIGPWRAQLSAQLQGTFQRWTGHRPLHTPARVGPGTIDQHLGAILPSLGAEIDPQIESPVQINAALRQSKPVAAAEAAARQLQTLATAGQPDRGRLEWERKARRVQLQPLQTQPPAATEDRGGPLQIQISIRPAGQSRLIGERHQRSQTVQLDGTQPTGRHKFRAIPTPIGLQVEATRLIHPTQPRRRTELLLSEQNGTATIN